MLPFSECWQQVDQVNKEAFTIYVGRGDLIGHFLGDLSASLASRAHFQSTEMLQYTAVSSAGWVPLAEYIE